MGKEPISRYIDATRGNKGKRQQANIPVFTPAFNEEHLRPFAEIFFLSIDDMGDDAPPETLHKTGRPRKDQTGKK